MPRIYVFIQIVANQTPFKHHVSRGQFKAICVQVYPAQNRSKFMQAFCHAIRAGFYSSQSVKTPKWHGKTPSWTTFLIPGRVNLNAMCFIFLRTFRTLICPADDLYCWSDIFRALICLFRTLICLLRTLICLLRTLICPADDLYCWSEFFIFRTLICLFRTSICPRTVYVSWKTLHKWLFCARKDLFFVKMFSRTKYFSLL
jgi:hypothetical protein